jgi:hypothetical protein
MNFYNTMPDFSWSPPCTIFTPCHTRISRALGIRVCPLTHPEENSKFWLSTVAGTGEAKISRTMAQAFACNFQQRYATTTKLKTAVLQPVPSRSTLGVFARFLIAPKKVGLINIGPEGSLPGDNTGIVQEWEFFSSLHHITALTLLVDHDKDFSILVFRPSSPGT